VPDNPYEVYEAAKWMQALFEADTGAGGLFQTGNPKINGAFMDLVPEEVKLPAVRYHVQGSHSVRGVGPGKASKIMVKIDWLVVVMREGHEVTPLLPIVMRLDTLLEGATGSTTLCNIDSCVNMEPYQILETDKSGVQVRHAGAIYRTIVIPK